MKFRLIAFIVFALALLEGSAGAEPYMPSMRSMRVRFAGEQVVTLIRFSNYCTMSGELYQLHGGETDVIHMPVESKAQMLGSLDNQGECEYPNGMYLIDGVAYRIFHTSFACKTQPGEYESHIKYFPGSVRMTSKKALERKLMTGECSWDASTRFCRKIMAGATVEKSILWCTNDGGAVDVWVRNPETGVLQVSSFAQAEVEKHEGIAREIENVNDDIYRLEGMREGCYTMSDRGACFTFAVFLMSPDRVAKGIGVMGVFGCQWISGTCVKILDHKLDDLKYEKDKLRKEQEEREAKAKAEGAVPSPSPSTVAGGASGPGSSEHYPDPFPPIYNGEAIITEDPPGPMPPGSGSGGPPHGSHL